MKKIAMLIVALLVAGTACGEKMEVYLHVPGETPIHAVGDVKFQRYLVEVTFPWGVTYTTHMANVVLVRRKDGSMAKNKSGTSRSGNADKGGSPMCKNNRSPLAIRPCDMVE